MKCTLQCSLIFPLYFGRFVRPIRSFGFAFDGIAGIMHNTELWKKLAEASPIANIKNVKTPTLVMVGKKDQRTLPDQGLSYYHMLKELKVPTK